MAPAASVGAHLLWPAEAIWQAVEQQQILVAEAGTGTGKTFAYLVPALLAGHKVLLSTGTKTLQDQLFSRDLPLVRQALSVPVRVALLKDPEIRAKIEKPMPAPEIPQVETDPDLKCALAPDHVV